MKMEIELEQNKKNKSPDKWEIDCWVDKLIEAEEIRKDPEKMKHVAPRLQKKATIIKSLAELREKAKQVKEDSDED